jgi:hypothetical protein
MRFSDVWIVFSDVSANTVKKIQVWITGEFLGLVKGTANSDDGLYLWSFGLFVSAQVYYCFQSVNSRKTL